MRVHLVRHGQSTWNREGRLQGQTLEPPLTDLGREQAADAAQRLAGTLAGVPRERILLVASDQVRAAQTAQVLADALGLPVETDVRLREQGLGELEGRLTCELVAQEVPEGLDVSEVRWGAGESVQDVHARASALVADLRVRAGAGGVDEVVLVTRGDTLRVLRAVLAGRGHREVDWGDAVANGSVVTVRL